MKVDYIVSPLLLPSRTDSFQKSYGYTQSPKTTYRRNPQNELKPGAFAPGAGVPTLLHGEVAPGAGASRDSFPEIQSATVASAAPGLHPVDAPTLSNRPLYQSWGAEPSALTIGAASELIRYDGFAFLYAKPGHLPPSSPVFRRNTRLGLQH